MVAKVVVKIYQKKHFCLTVSSSLNDLRGSPPGLRLSFTGLASGSSTLIYLLCMASTALMYIQGVTGVVGREAETYTNIRIRELIDRCCCCCCCCCCWRCFCCCCCCCCYQSRYYNELYQHYSSIVNTINLYQ